MDAIEAKQSFDYSFIASAYHEAGHTVIALYSFLYVSNVNILSQKQRTWDRNYGETHFITPNFSDKDLNRVILINEIKTLHSGLICEKMYYKDICGSSRFPNHLKSGSYQDISVASSIIRQHKLFLPGKETSLFKKHISIEIENILKENWDAVKSIAHSLYQKKRLSFSEIKYILTRKTNHREFWKDKFKKIEMLHKENISANFVRNILMD